MKTIGFYLNNERISQLKLNLNDNLNKIREKINKKKKRIPDDAKVQTIDGQTIDVEDEDENILKEVIKNDDKLFYRTEFVTVKINVDDFVICELQISLSDNLSIVRKKLAKKITENYCFYGYNKNEKDFCKIEIEDEDENIVSEIIYKNELKIKSNSDNSTLFSDSFKNINELDDNVENKSNFNFNDSHQNNSDKKNNNENSNKKNINESNKIFVLFENKPYEVTISEKSTLQKLREELSNKIPNDAMFLNGESIIQKSTENIIKIESLLSENSKFIQMKIFEENQIKKKNEKDNSNINDEKYKSINNNNENGNITNQNKDEHNNNENKKEIKSEKVEEEKTEEKEVTYTFNILGYLEKHKFAPNVTLALARLNLGKTLPENVECVKKDGSIISQEEDWTLEEVADENNTIYFKLSKNKKKIFENSKKEDENDEEQCEDEENNKSDELKEEDEDEDESVNEIKSQRYNNNKKSEIIKYKSDLISNKKDKKDCLTFMVLGETGSGKTTFLNAFLNFVLDIKFEDNKRYILIEEEEANECQSKTSDVNIYYIKRTQKYPPIKIIDTPGFGDTRGLEVDNQTVKKIGNLFKDDLDEINLICLVVKASTSKLTDSQQYVFSSVINLFGNDVAENFISIITFYDGSEPLATKALMDPKSGFSQIKSKIRNEWYLNFNDGVIFTKSKTKDNKLNWKETFSSFDKFMKKLNKVPKKSLDKSRRIFELKEKLNADVENLSIELNIGLSKMENLRAIINKFNAEKTKIQNSEQFEFEEITYIPQYVEKPKGTFTTHCKHCNRTCHKVCYIDPKKGNKRYCWAMDDRGKCRQCPGKCSYTYHENCDFYVEWIENKNKKNIKDLNKYLDPNSNLSKFEQIKKGLLKDFANSFNKCFQLEEEVRNKLNKIKKEALNPNFYETSENYIDGLIIEQEIEKQKGYKDRINALKELKKRHELIKQICLQKNRNLRELEKFKQEILTKLKNEEFSEEDLEKMFCVNNYNLEINENDKDSCKVF